MKTPVRHGFDKVFYGMAVMGERGQVVIPKEARTDFDIKPGDKLLVVGNPNHALVLLKADVMKEFAKKILDAT